MDIKVPRQVEFKDQIIKDFQLALYQFILEQSFDSAHQQRLEISPERKELEEKTAKLQEDMPPVDSKKKEDRMKAKRLAVEIGGIEFKLSRIEAQRLKIAQTMADRAKKMKNCQEMLEYVSSFNYGEALKNLTNVKDNEAEVIPKA